MPKKPQLLRTLDCTSPGSILCYMRGKCCFEQAYVIGRLDERNGFPDILKGKTKTPKKAKPKK